MEKSKLKLKSVRHWMKVFGMDAEEFYEDIIIDHYEQHELFELENELNQISAHLRELDDERFEGLFQYIKKRASKIKSTLEDYALPVFLEGKKISMDEVEFTKSCMERSEFFKEYILFLEFDTRDIEKLKKHSSSTPQTDNDVSSLTGMERRELGQLQQQKKVWEEGWDNSLKATVKATEHCQKLGRKIIREELGTVLYSYKLSTEAENRIWEALRARNYTKGSGRPKGAKNGKDCRRSMEKNKKL